MSKEELEKRVDNAFKKPLLFPASNEDIKFLEELNQKIDNTVFIKGSVPALKNGKIWKTIKDFSNYMISNDGQILNTKRGKLLKAYVDTHGYLTIKVHSKKSFKHMRLHRVVAEYFVKNPDEYETVNHIDGNKLNNSFENLEWMTAKENSNHAAKNNLYLFGESNHLSKLTEKEVVEIKKSLLCYKKGDCNKLSKKYNVHQKTINSIKNNKTWTRVIV